MSNEKITVLGKDIKESDVLHVWWDNTKRGGEAHKDIITGIKPYIGRYSDTARIVDFKYLRTDMTIFNEEQYQIYSQGE
jgi:hypothetical protein